MAHQLATQCAIGGDLTPPVLRTFGATALIVEDAEATQACFLACGKLGLKTSLSVYLHWAGLCFEAGHVHKAYALSQTCLEADAQDVAIRQDFARYALASGRVDEAEPHIKTWIANAPADPDANMLAARIAFYRGQVEQACDHANRALDVEPSHLGAFRILANCRSKSVADARMDVFRRLAEAGDLEPRREAQLNFAIGALEEAKGQHAAAFRRYQTANKAMENLAAERNESFDLGRLKADQALFDAVVEQSEIQLSAAPGAVKPVFIFGMPRSGSTLIEQILSMHSQITALGERPDCLNWRAETLVIAHRDGVDAAAHHIRRMAGQWRQSYLAAAGTSGLIVDKNLLNYQSASLIQRLFPESRVLWTKREEADQTLSIFASPFASQITFTNRIDDILDFSAFASEHKARCAAHWQEDLFEVEYEAVIDHAEAYVRAVLAFCELPFERDCLRFYQSNRVVQTVSAAQVRRPIYASSVGRAAAFGDALQPWHDRLNRSKPALAG